LRAAAGAAGRGLGAQRLNARIRHLTVLATVVQRHAGTTFVVFGVTARSDPLAAHRCEALADVDVGAGPV